MTFSKKCVKTTVIIPIFNSKETLGRCLEALFHSIFKDFEVIVVDDSSTDDSSQIAREFGCQVISLKKRSGPAVARNRGAKAASGRFLIFMDSDVLCEPETLSRLITPLEEGWDVCVGMYTPIPGYRNFFSIYKNVFIWHYHDICNGRIDWFWTACGAIKKEVFDIFGGLSEFYSWNSIEDIDLGYRMTKNNYKILLNKEAIIKHYHYFGLGAVLRNDFKKSRDWTYLNLLRNHFFSFKHPLAQFKYRGFGILGSLLLIFMLFFSIAEFRFFTVAALVFFILPFIEKGFFSSLLHYGGIKVFIGALFLKPIDDLVISIGAIAGLMCFLFKR